MIWCVPGEGGGAGRQVTGVSGRGDDQGRKGHRGCPSLQWAGSPRRLCHAMVWARCLESGPGFISWPPNFPWPPSNQLLTLSGGTRNRTCHSVTQGRNAWAQNSMCTRRTLRASHTSVTAHTAVFCGGSRSGRRASAVRDNESATLPQHAKRIQTWESGS